MFLGWICIILFILHWVIKWGVKRSITKDADKRIKNWC